MLALLQLILLKLLQFFKDKTTSSRSYAKLLLEIKLGRRLTSEEEADHVDEDKTNDTLPNIQVLSREQNLLKNNLHREENLEVYGFECAWCGNRFILKLHEVNNKLRQSKTGLSFCSRNCSISFNKVNGVSNYVSHNVTPSSVIEEIKTLKEKGFSIKAIAETLNIDRHTVSKYI